MRQISKIHFTHEGEIFNYFNFLKKFEIRTERPTKAESISFLDSVPLFLFSQSSVVLLVRSNIND